MSIVLKKAEQKITRQAAYTAAVICRREPVNEYDAGIGLACKAIFRAARLLREGDVKTALTEARLAAAFQQKP